MGRRADPERISQAGRAAIRNRLLSDGLAPEMAERWLAAWEVEAAMRELPRDSNYWTVGETWIAEERAARRAGW
jgi:hypothetical protein